MLELKQCITHRNSLSVATRPVTLNVSKVSFPVDGRGNRLESRISVVRFAVIVHRLVSIIEQREGDAIPSIDAVSVVVLVGKFPAKSIPSPAIHPNITCALDAAGPLPSTDKRSLTINFPSTTTNLRK